jgi:hypothetical protein
VLRKHARNRADAMEKKREQRLKTVDMFANHQATLQEATIDEIVAEQKVLASTRLVEILAQRGPLKFSRVLAGLLQPYMLRETNVKDICVDLAKVGTIENTWGAGNRKPRDEDIISLRRPRLASNSPG